MIFIKNIQFNKKKLINNSYKSLFFNKFRVQFRPV